MAKGMYIGVGNVARKAKKIYVGVNGIARKVKKIYVGVNGIARLAWSGKPEIKNGGKLTLDYTVSEGFASPSNVSNSEYTIVANGTCSSSPYKLNNGNTISKNLVIGRFSTTYWGQMGEGYTYSSPNKAYVINAYSTVSSVYKYLMITKTDLTRSFLTLSYPRKYTVMSGTKDYVIFRGGGDQNGEVNDSAGEIFHKDTDAKTTRSFSYYTYGAGGEIGGYAIFLGGRYNNSSTKWNVAQFMDNSLVLTTGSMLTGEDFLSLPRTSASNEKYCIFASGDVYNANLVRTNITVSTSPVGLSSAKGLALWFERGKVYEYDENLVKSDAVAFGAPTYNGVIYSASTVGDYTIVTQGWQYKYLTVDVLNIA